MFNIGFTELIILGVIGLLVLGPEQLPEVARKMAKLFNELKRAKDEIMAPVEDLKAEAGRMLERARESAAQKELDELLHRIDPNNLASYDPLKKLDPDNQKVRSPTDPGGHPPTPGQVTAADMPNYEPAQQKLDIEEATPPKPEHGRATEVDENIQLTDSSKKNV
jgi:sec-independent protein translocase protein TatB